MPDAILVYGHPTCPALGPVRRLLQQTGGLPAPGCPGTHPRKFAIQFGFVLLDLFQE